ncbi:MAG: sodium:solute symporter [Flavobacteriaceae bacterium TMED179]|nr:MAG: sodium:solute symporter [Flavobacteriaceae bacterium TMED179]|tara:strand:- start:3630 stop:5279 length:1650 start_codon:yes stop_codon:yes gene_type:complete
MELFDWIVLIITLTIIVLFGIWKNNSHKNIHEYLKGGNEARWWTVGLSVMATQASAITFLSTPGQAYHDGMGFVQFYFGLPFAMFVVCLFFIPIYHKLKVYTAYEFLENRFDIRVRTLTAILFLLQRGLASGITIYAPAIILSVVLGWNLKLMVILVGSLVITYTLIGGTKAVNVTQKQQMFIIFLGIFIAFGYIIKGFPEGISFSDALQIAGKAGKLEVLDFSFDLRSRYTFWSGLTGGFFLALSYFGTDQSQVQRYLSGKSLKESQIGLVMNGLLKVPMQFFILLIGVMVFVFYQFESAPLNFNPKAIASIKKTEELAAFKTLEIENLKTQQELKNALINRSNQDEIKFLRKKELDQRNKAKTIIRMAVPEQETNDKDYVFISFILNNLPSGLIGLLIAVIFSAAMSSTASELNALATTTTIDLYKRNIGPKSELHYVNVSKVFTLCWGLLAIFFASIGNLFENLIQLINIIGSVFYGTILGIFLVAIFIKSIKAKAVFWSAVVSESIVIFIFVQDLVSFLWLNLIGALLTVIISRLFQKLHDKKYT